MVVVAAVDVDDEEERARMQMLEDAGKGAFVY